MKLIADLRERASENTLCELFNIKRSSYYDSRQRKQTIDVERLHLRAKVTEMHRLSRGAAGSRSIVSMLATQGITIWRFKARRLLARRILQVNSRGHTSIKSL